MAIKLKLRFVGLSTFVQQGDVTHVLIPPTGGHAAHGVPPHETRLFHGWPEIGVVGAPVPPSDVLGRGVLRIRDRGRVPGAPALPTDLFDVSELAGGAPVRPDALGAAPDAGVLYARIELDTHGLVKAWRRTAYALPDANGQLQPVVKRTFVTWDETVDVGDLEITFQPFDGGAEQSLALNLPDAAADDPLNDVPVNLAIYNVPVNEMPPNVPMQASSGSPVMHFGVYYEMLQAPQARPVPVFTSAIDAAPLLGGEFGACPTSRAR